MRGKNLKKKENPACECKHRIFISNHRKVYRGNGPEKDLNVTEDNPLGRRPKRQTDSNGSEGN